MSDKFDASAYRYAITMDAMLAEAAKAIGEPWSSRDTPTAPVGDHVTLYLDGVSMVGVVEESDAAAGTMSGTIVQVFETPPAVDEEDEIEWRAFRAGFSISCEGWNAEYPPPDDDDLRERFNEWRKGESS